MSTASIDIHDELAALRDYNDALPDRPAFILRSYWKTFRPLVRKGWAVWGAPPAGFRRTVFAGLTITDAGRAALAKAQRGAE